MHQKKSRQKAGIKEQIAQAQGVAKPDAIATWFWGDSAGQLKIAGFAITLSPSLRRMIWWGSVGGATVGALMFRTLQLG